MGRVVNSRCATCEPERVNAIVDFAPLENPSHIRMFLGCTNWIRWFLPATYPVASQTLTSYLKPSKEIPKLGFGHKDGKTDGDKAVFAIKIMAKHHIENAAMDEVGAITGAQPLEMVADSCGFG